MSIECMLKSWTPLDKKYNIVKLLLVTSGTQKVFLMYMLLMLHIAQKLHRKCSTGF